MMKPVLQCPIAADRGQSSHNQFKSSNEQLPTRYLSVNAERKKYNSTVNGYSSEVLSSGIITSLQTQTNLTADGKHETQFSSTIYLYAAGQAQASHIRQHLCVIVQLRPFFFLI